MLMTILLGWFRWCPGPTALGAFALTLDPDTSDSNQTWRFPFILTFFFKKKKQNKTKNFYFWGISAHPQFQRIWTVFCMLRFNVFLSWLVGSKRKISFKKDSWIRHQISQRNRREIKEECLCSQEGRPQIWVSFSLFFSSLDRYCFCSFTFW